MSYKIGTKLYVRTDLQVYSDISHIEYFMHNSNDSNTVTTEMKALGGQIATIVGINFADQYTIDLDSNEFSWTDEMFLSLTRFNKGLS